MKTPRLFVLLLASFFAVLGPRPAEARVEVSFDFFYDSLTPYGDWVEVGDYGNCWRPADVDRDWTPYTDGYWAYTDAGWTWVSYEDFGGIVYHYGRWVRVEDEGWFWVPDYEWSPAWVSWRQSDDYVGWAPLPPEARWRPSVGISIWVDRDCDIGPAYYNFCRVRDFGAPVLRPVICDRYENVTIIRRTVNITNITYNTRYHDGAVIYNGGPNYKVINGRSARRIPALKLVRDADFRFERRKDGDRHERRHEYNARTRGNELVVSAPLVKPPTNLDAFRTGSKKKIGQEKVSRGWNVVKNEEVRQELRKEMHRQTRGLTPETTPARPVAVADLEAVPEKADPKASMATTGERSESGDEKRSKEEKMEREKGRGGSKESDASAVAGRELKPFKPMAETEEKSKRTPEAAAPSKMEESRKKNERLAEDTEKKMRDRGEAEQRKKMQVEREKAMRKESETASKQQEKERQRTQEMDSRRRQEKDQQQAVEKQRRQAMEQQQSAQEAARKQMERAASEQRKGRDRSQENERRMQKAPQEPMKQQKAMKQQNEGQRSSSDEEKKDKKDKKNK